MAVEIAGKVVEREIKESDHQALIDEFIRNVGMPHDRACETLRRQLV